MGQEKALLPFVGEPLIQRIVARGLLLTPHILIITNHPEAFEFLRLPLSGDLYPAAGPLVGLYTALKVAQTPRVALVGCDMPFASPAVFASLLEWLDHEPCDAAIPKSERGLEPLHAVYRREACLPAVQSALDAGERSLAGWLSRVRACEVPAERLRTFDPGLNAFCNLNTPEEYRDAQRDASENERP